MKIGIIGAGNMGGAIARGLAADPDFCTADITVCSPNNHGELDALKADYPDMNVDTDNEKAILGTDIIILAVKPWLVYGASDEQVKSVSDIFSRLGSVMVIDENQMTACMALASCGIAYAMRYVRAASEGGVELGVKADLAKDIVLQTMQGAAALLQTTGAHPEAEIDKVTTPGGITIKGLNAMEAHGFTTSVIEGLKASK